MKGKMLYFPFTMLVAIITFANAAYLLPDESIAFNHCVGPACPTYSLPLKTERPGSHHAMNCSRGDIVPHPSECQSFYICNRNGNGVKMMCTFGYAFHPRIKLCVLESLVKSCGKVYCPPSVLIGTVPDSGNCTRYYRCVYGVPMHYQCEPGFIYDEELGKCMEYGENAPVCISGESNSVGTTTTENAFTSNPLPSTTEHNLTTTTTVPESSSEQITSTTTTSTVVPDSSTPEVITEEPTSIPTSSDSPKTV